MPRQVITRVLLVCAVLFAQQTALAHDFWHATAQKTTPAKGDKLCDLHDLLGTVLGAVSGISLGHQLLSVSEVGFVAMPDIVVHGVSLRPHSRGPPAIS